MDLEAKSNRPTLLPHLLVPGDYAEQVLGSNVFGVMVGDRAGRIIYANATLLAMLGYNPQMPPDLRWNQLTPPEYTILDVQAVAELTASGQWGPAEKEFLAADHSRVPVLVSAAVIGRDADGGLLVACCVVDLRPVRAAQRRSTANAERSAMFVESIPEILLTTTTDGAMDYFSPYFYEYTGMQPEQVLGWGWIDVIHPDDLGRAEIAWREALQSGEPHVLEYRMRRSDGEYRWFRARSVAQRDASGIVTKWIGICVDVDDERRLLDERIQLLEREQAARTAAESAAMRLGYLQRTTAALAGAQTFDQVAGVIAEQSVSAFGAAACAIRLLSSDGKYLEEVGVVGHDQQLADKLSRVPIEAPLTITDAVRTGQMIVVRDAAEVAARYPALAELTAQRGYESFVAVPLFHEGQAIGVLGLAFRGPLRLVPEDLILLEAIAQQCIQAIERARLYAAEQAARAESAELLAQLDMVINKAPIGMGFVDTDFRYVRVNEALAAMNGTSVEAHIGRLAHELFPDFAPVWETYWKEVLATGQAIADIEMSAVLDHAVRRSQVGYYPVRLAGETVRGIGIVVSDVTERRKIELTQTLLAQASSILGESLEYERALQHVAELIVPDLADYCAINLVENDRVQTVALLHHDPIQQPLLERLYSATNGAFSYDLPLGRVVQTRTTLLTPNLTPLIDQLPYAKWQRDLIHDLGAQSSLVVPLLARSRVLGAITMVMAGSGRRYSEQDLALAEELSRRCALAIENALLYRDAQEAIQLRDAFLSVAAHELRTPLTSLYGNAQLLQRRFARQPEQLERDIHSLDVIVLQAEKLNRMIGTLLDVSRLQRGQLALSRAPVDLCRLIQQLVVETQPTLPTYTLEIELPPRPLIVNGDELRLEQVFANLVQNGVKYSPGGGTVTISVEQRGNQVLVTVRDHGIGIPADALPQLFQRFYRAPNATDKQIAGLGIGLFVAREIVQLHGGTIAIDSAEGKGTTVSIRLPLIE